MMQKMNNIPAGGEEHGHDGPGHNHRQPDDDNNVDIDDNEENHDDGAEHSDGDRGQHAHEAAEAVLDVLGGGRGGEAALQGRALLRREGQELPAVRRSKIAFLSSRKFS